MIRRCAIAIVGGGITGLATAYYLGRKRPNLSVAVLEASRFWGGKIITERRNGAILEWGADSFLTSKPGALELVQELGMHSEVVSADSSNAQTLVLRRGRLHPIPKNFYLLAPLKIADFLHSPLFSASAKLNIYRERFRPRRQTPGDETIAAFVQRRFGREALEILGEPLLAGIYMGDAEKLSVSSTFPRLAQMEREYGSVTRGLQREKPHTGAGRSLFVTLRNGMDSLAQALVAKTNAALCTATPVERVQKIDGGYRLFTGQGEVHANDIIFTIDPENLYRIIAGLDEVPELKQFATTSSVVALMLFGRQVELPRAFGLLIPRSEGKQIAALSFSSRKFPDRVPGGKSLVRAFLGGYGRDSVLGQSDETIILTVRKELDQILGVKEEPEFVRVVRWGKANPQYQLGHAELMDRVRNAFSKFPGLHLAGSPYYGLGIPDCIHQAKAVADSIAERYK